MAINRDSAVMEEMGHDFIKAGYDALTAMLLDEVPV